MLKLLRLDDVKAATGLGRSSLYDLMARGEFPRPVPLTAKARGWLESEVRAWQEARIASRDQHPKKAA
ncbi:helix-turn-helix transcriptional regulator [Ancylobacter dichloromethanicus]|uniref:Transcriptional regulator n=1 Tax=Ancylobacter dichloromethanicus TaxID=518825 RepID=A0A9W6MYW5_9HYPH|nr:AlpA family transcriptional regulator [Ancylobacter dichloromethanicus]GLK71563.1 transcriptional regulator [Ancylobacter dichloromethanicus]